MDENQDYSHQNAEQAISDTSQLGMKAGRAVGDMTRPITRPIRRQISRAVRNIGRRVRKALVRKAKQIIKRIARALADLLIKALAIIGPVGIIFLAFIFLICSSFTFLLEERGSNESDDLDPDVQNPSYVDGDSGITKAIAMTEPQAVIDAYYKYLSSSSYYKAYGGKLFRFNDKSQTSDFAGLRDYYKVENYFYLSDDFIRSLDEMLHNEDIFYPEQVIKPVWGQNILLKDTNGQTGRYYTARLPYDTPDGESMFDEEQVKNFSEILADGEKLKADGTSGSDSQLLTRSQTPDAEDGRDGYYTLKERNILSDNLSDTESGIWDYGFGSVLEYQKEEKQRYIECTYDKVDCDFDYKDFLGYDDEGNEVWSDWKHSEIISIDIAGNPEGVYTQCGKIVTNRTTDEQIWRYQLPDNIEAILYPNKSWDMTKEPNKEVEKKYTAIYGRSASNQHIDMAIEDSWDADIDQVQFKDEALQEYNNKGGGLYPINIAVVSHAATFSGNIHYTITPAGKDGCVVEEADLEVNTDAVTDHRQPVQNIAVAGGCSSANLTAHRTGKYYTQKPRVEETDSPWGFQYLDEYAANYRAYIPEDYREDRDFFVRTGLNADENSEVKAEYENNLKFMMDLGLLRLYTGNVSLGATGSVDLAELSNPDSDLYILSHVIAAEAGPSKLDELMVGAVFVNRVQSSKFPNSFQEVLQQTGQYACYTDGNYRKANPTEREIASAIQVISGLFSIPDNILGQSASVQGTIYKMVDNPSYLNDHYYCTMGKEAISQVDRFGRPATKASQLEALAKSLSNSTAEQVSTFVSKTDLSGAAFIGDSLTEGLNNAVNLSDNGATVIAKSGATLEQIKILCEKSSTLNEDIRNVYLLIGTNSCGIQDSRFEKQYKELLDVINSKTGSYANIILTTIPPVVDGKSNASNSHVIAKNKIIQAISQEYGYKVLDIHTPLEKDGKLNPEYSADGVHLTKAGYQLWYSKLRAGFFTSQDGDDAADEFTYTDEDGLPIYSEYTLYDISEFDVLAATNMQATLRQADTSLFATVKNLFEGLFGNVEEFINQFFNIINNAFSTPQSTTCFAYEAPYNDYDVRSVIYHSIAFTNQVWFSTAESTADAMADSEKGLTFLFVGKNSLLGFGTSSTSSFQLTPGVGTSVDGMISPTKTYYQTLTPYSSNTGYMEISTPAGTNLLAVANGEVTAVGTDIADARGKYVTIATTLDGDTYEITYGYLGTVSTVAGRTIHQGDLIGLSGKKQDGTAALYLSVRKNGTLINPSSIFYQMSYSSGAGLGGNLNHADGTIDREAIAALDKQLTSYVNAGGGKYHTVPLNTLQYKQCTWWAFGRGFEYLQSINSPITNSQYRNAIHGNGGDYLRNNQSAGLFAYGNTPRPNSLVCYQGSPGHVAYVEAVDYVNQKYYISEAGGGTYWGGIVEKDFGSAAHGSGGQYAVGVFIYLDEPLR